MMLNLPYLDQLVKIPLLVEHYQEHHHQNRDLSFIDFLALHYRNAPAHDKRDNSLPFKSPIRGQQAGVQLSIPTAPFVMSLVEPTLTATVNRPLTISHPVAGCAFGIFQPPRV